ncbi:MAG: hypothetical protein AB7S36_15505 [Planctomycetota bacterium]
MRNDRSVTLRVSRELLARTDALRKLLERDPEVAGVYGPPSRATLLRLAILRGLEQLERRYAPGWEIDEVSASSDNLHLPADGEAVPEAVPEDPSASKLALDEAFGVSADEAGHNFPTMFDSLNDSDVSGTE